MQKLDAIEIGDTNSIPPVSGTDMADYSYLVQTASGEEAPASTTAKLITAHNCYMHVSYEAPAIAICGVCLVTGIIYCFLGYRFVKAVQFLTGFLFTSVLLYLILDRQHPVSLYVNAGIAVAAGVIIGIIAIFLRYVGMFLTGFVAGAVIGIIISTAWQSAVISPSIWAVVGLLIGNGAIVASISLKWQRTMIILNTSFIGATLLASSLDYFADHLALVQRAWRAISSLERGIIYWTDVCWYGWLVVSLWPCIFALGSIVQWYWTSVGQDHTAGWRCSCKGRSAPDDATGDTRLTNSHSDICKQSVHGSTRQLPYVCKGADCESDPKKRSVSVAHRRCFNCAHRSVSYESRPWRTIYQSRRAHGDVICQSYLESLQRISSSQRSTPHAYSPWGSLGDTPTAASDQTNLAAETQSTLQCVEFAKSQM